MSLEGLLLCGRGDSRGVSSSCLVAFQQVRNHLAILFAALLLRFRPLRELLMHDRIDDPVRRVGGAQPRDSRHPAEGFELLENRLGLVPFQAAHASVAALDVAVGDALQLVGQDVVGDIGQPVVVVRQPQHAGIERQGVRQQEAVQEVRNAPCSVLRDDGGQCRPPACSTQCQTTQSRAKMPLYLPKCEVSFRLRPSSCMRSRCFFSSSSRIFRAPSSNFRVASAAKQVCPSLAA